MEFERVRQIASDIFGVAPDEITPLSSQDQIKTWNSLRHLNLIVALEEEFKVTFESDELQRVKTFGQIASLLEAKLDGKTD